MNNNYIITRNKVIEYFQLDTSVSNDYLLRKIHFSRLKGELPYFVNKFLIKTFVLNDDVRFFNEFLWIAKDYDNVEKMVNHFHNNIEKNGFYKYCYHECFKDCLDISETLQVGADENLKNSSIGLIGSPFHFILAFKMLKKMDIVADVINVKYNSSKIQNLILNNFFTSLIYRWIFGKKNYFEIVIGNKEQLKNIVLPKIYDIGFHKLGFIISKPLISQFNKGLINDHWGALPLFKGRSTLEYSKLFGAELVVTNHLIKPEIDAGDIVCYTRLDAKKIKGNIYFGLGNRIVHSLGLLASDLFINADNSKGKMFYEMHPWLLKHVKNIKIN